MKKINKLLIILALVLTFAVQGNVTFAQYGIQAKTKSCVANQTLPDSACTPGAVLTTNVKVICKVGYTKTVRSVSLKVRKQVFAEYGIPYKLSGKYEVDHLISLELGGSNDISNLWPESYGLKNGARIKDKLENSLHAQVCKGKMTIAEAQKEISGDWLSYYSGVKTPAVNVPAPIPVPTPAPTVITPTVPTIGPEVKKSTTGICHAKGTTYYDRTLIFTPFNSLTDCLASGGRLPL